MTKKKPKKSLRARTRNPKMIEEEEEEKQSHLPNQNPPPPPPPAAMIEVAEEDEIQEVQIQNPNETIQVEKEETLQSDETTCTNPKLIEEESNLPDQNPETIQVEEEEVQVVQIENPKTIEKEILQPDETTTDSVHEELQTQSLKMMVEEEEEEEEEEEDEEEEEEEEEEEGSQPSHNEEKDHHDDHQNQTHGEVEEEEEEDDDEEEAKLEPEGMALFPSCSPSAQISPMHDLIPENPSPTASNHHQQTEGMTLSSTFPSPPAYDSFMCELVSESPPPTLPRKAPKRKKPSSKYQRKTLNYKQRAALEKKLQCSRENLQPVPFVPTKTLDFSKHEKLFKRLGLWDFANIEFDHEIRSDLLVQLIVNYNFHSRSSTVNDLKIKVNRADLARALKLPVKKSIPSGTMDLDPEVLSEESISFLDEFVSNWILLHEDMWMMPDEVLTNTRYIKEGQPEKVDWPGLIWFMVEKELSQAPNLKSCYYASHLQYLMRSQKAVLFKEEPRLEVSMEQEEENAVVKRSLEDFQGEELGKQHIELTLGQERNDVEQQGRDEDVMDFQECKEPGDSSQWFLDGKNNFEEHCFRRCNNVVKIDGLDDQCAVKEEQEEEKYDLSSKCSLEGLASTDLLQGMGTTNIPYSPSVQLQLLDENSGELLPTRSNTHMNQGGPSMFGNTCKRELSHDEEDIPHDIFSGHNKRMKNNGSWENKASDFEYCMEQMNSLMGKARAMYEQKDEACMSAHMNQEFLMSELQQRDNIIATLHKTKCEEIQKREVEMYKLEHELRMMSNLVVGYRRALKQTQREFSEYRELCPQPEESLYKDVSGGGGLVLSTTELEKQRLEREEEVRMQRSLFGELVKKFEGSCLAILEASQEKVHLLDKRLLELDEEFKVLKEISADRKMPEAEGCIANEV